MSAAETEVAEAITEADHTPEPSNEGIDIGGASESIAQDLFGLEPKEEEVEEVTEIDEEPEAEEVAEIEEEEPEVELKTAPQSWKKDMHESWDKIDPETQEYIELREQQMKDGVDVKKDDAELGMRMRDALSPYSNILKKNNVDPVHATQKLMAMHYQIVSSTPEQRKALFDDMAKSYGVTSQPVDEETQKIMANPFVSQLMQKINRLEQNQNMSIAESKQDREVQVNQQVEEFAKDHPYFDDLSENIARLIRADYSLEDAYKMAFKNSPYFEKDLDKKREEAEKEKLEAKKKDAEKVKKAKSVNVRGRDTNKAPTAPKGTMEDTMRETMRKIKNRN